MPKTGPGMVLVVVMTSLTGLAGCFGGGVPPTEELRAVNPLTPCGDLGDWTLDDQYDHRMRLFTNFGTIDVAIFSNEVPLTAAVILDLANTGFYDGTRVHRVNPDFAIFAGDPNSRDANRRPSWGAGGPGYFIPSEFHPFLSFDRPGVVGLHTAGPHTGGSQFFITTIAVPEIDPVRPVIGHVVRGMDVVEAIANVPRYMEDEVPPGQEFLIGQPKEDVLVQGVETLDPPTDIDAAPASLAVASIDCTSVAPSGVPAPFLVHVRNTGHRILNVTWGHDAPEDWSVELTGHGPFFGTPAGRTTMLRVNVTVPPGATTGGTVNLTFDADGGAHAEVPLRVVVDADSDARPTDDGTFLIDYVGFIDDGRIFDTSEPNAYDGTIDARGSRNATGGLQPLECRYGAGQAVLCRDPGSAEFKAVIPGFARAIRDAGLDHAGLARVLPDQGFGVEEFGSTNLGGRTLYYHVVIRHIS